MEIWKKLEHDEIIDDYMVSNYGNIYRISTNYTFKTKNDSENYIARYFKCKNGCFKMFYVHRLVAQAFIPNPNNYPCIDHIDSNRQNNNISNLRWCTYRQNSIWSLPTQKTSREKTKLALKKMLSCN